jgi:signal transduction histidine kinase
VWLQTPDKRRLRRWLTVFFLALAVPSAVLIVHSYQQLRWESLIQVRGRAEDLAARADGRLQAVIRAEEARSVVDFDFLVVAGDPTAGFVQRSALSAIPADSTLPGLIGYFQVDEDGEFSTPLLPRSDVEPGAFGLSAEDLEARSRLARKVWQILASNQLVEDAEDRARASAREPSGRQAPAAAKADQLSNLADESIAGTAFAEQDLATDSTALLAFDSLQRADSRLPDFASGRPSLTQSRAPPAVEPRAQDTASTSAKSVGIEGRGPGARRERVVAPVQSAAVEAEVLESRSSIPLRIFYSEVESFRFNLLNSGQIVLYRNVWRDGTRVVQGALIDPEEFLGDTVAVEYAADSLQRISDLVIDYQGQRLATYDAASNRYDSDPGGGEATPLYDTRLSAPLNDLELSFRALRLPAPPGRWLIVALALALTLVLLGGFSLLYRLGCRQIDLARQQQDFVAAVSHELKTPLTSIRMYGEMLREGWVGEDKKPLYYQYIHDESERLSRLINNILQLSRVTRQELQLHLIVITVGELLDAARSAMASCVERGGFILRLDCDESVSASRLRVDPDAFVQIFINLVDNAVKFAAHSDPKVVEVGCRNEGEGRVCFRVRDYGPGIAAGEMQAIFGLFYRSDSERLREIPGTGIGLALVSRLTAAMDGEIEVLNQKPGAEFRLFFPVHSSLT